MNYPFKKTSSLSRFGSVALAAALTASLLGGCSLLPGKSTVETSESTEPSSSTQPAIIETTAPTTVPTTPPTTEAPKENVAIVKEQTSLRASPSRSARVNAQLDAGEELEVIRLEVINPADPVRWAFVNVLSLRVQGWVLGDVLDLSNVTLTYDDTSTPAGGSSTDTNNSTAATTPTTPPVNSITGTGTTTTPANSQVGTVNTNTLNIRASAGTNSDKVGTYTFGDRITILETKNGWGRTEKGWVSMQYVNTTTAGTTGTTGTTGGTTGSITNTGTGNAVITGTGVNVRSGAGTNNPVVATAQKGESITITETTMVGNTRWGRIAKGWICMDYVSVTGSIGGNTNTGVSTGTGSATTGTATVTGNGLNIRSSAGTNSAIVGSLAQGQTVNILETISIGGSQWGRIAQGWICLDYVRMN